MATSRTQLIDEQLLQTDQCIKESRELLAYLVREREEIAHIMASLRAELTICHRLLRVKSAPFDPDDTRP